MPRRHEQDNVCKPPCSSHGSFAVSLRAVPNGCNGSKQRCQVRKNLLATYRKRTVPAYTEHIALTRQRLLRAWQGLAGPGRSCQRDRAHPRLEAHGPDGLRQRPGLRPSNKPGLCADPTLHSGRDLAGKDGTGRLPIGWCTRTNFRRDEQKLPTGDLVKGGSLVLPLIRPLHRLKRFRRVGFDRTGPMDEAGAVDTGKSLPRTRLRSVRDAFGCEGID